MFTAWNETSVGCWAESSGSTILFAIFQRDRDVGHSQRRLNIQNAGRFHTDTVDTNTTMADTDGYHWYDRKSPWKPGLARQTIPASMDAVRLLPNLAFCQYR